MALKLITAPESYPVTREEAKEHLRIDHDDDDNMIDLYIAAAVSYVDGKYGQLQRALGPQVWELTYDAFPAGAIEIPLPPLISVNSIKYDDSTGVEQTIDPDNYVVDDESSPGWVVPIDTYTWPTPLAAANSVRIRFTAGYPDVVSASGSSAGVETGIPPILKAAILLIIGDLYEHRESVSPNKPELIPVPAAVESILWLYRIPTLA